MPAAMSADVQKRSKIISFSRMSTTLATTVLGIIAIPLINALGQGDKQKGYMLTALVVGLVGAGFYLIGFANVREHLQPVPNQKITLKSSVKAITQNRPLLLLLCCGLLGNIGTMLKQGMFLGLIIAPMFTKRFDSKTVFIGSRVFGIVVDVVFFFAGFENIPLVMFLYALTSIPLGMSSVVSATMLTNTIEYAEWKFGNRQEGLISSTQTLTAKIGMALSAGVTGAVLEIADYVPNHVTDETQMMIHGAFTLFCAVIGVLAIIPMLFNKFTDKEHERIVEELRIRKQQEANK